MHYSKMTKEFKINCMNNHEMTFLVETIKYLSHLTTLYDNKTLHLKLLTTKVLWTTGSWMWETIYAFAVLMFCLLCLCHCIKVKDMTLNIVKIIKHGILAWCKCLSFSFHTLVSFTIQAINTTLLTALKATEEQIFTVIRLQMVSFICSKHI